MHDMTGYYNVMSGAGAVPEVLGLHSTDGEEESEGRNNVSCKLLTKMKMTSVISEAS